MSTTITGLPNATTPLSGTERVPMDQSGATKDATTQDIANLAPGTDLTFTQSTRVLASSTGADVTLPVATDALPGLMAAADKAKLDGVAAGATANSSDATLLNRANHTGTQAAGTITGLATVATSGSYADLSNKPSLGTAAAANTGTAAGNVVVLDGSARLPAVDGSQLTGINATTDLGYTASTRVLTSSTGADVTLPLATTSDPGLMAAADKTKLDGIAAGATVNSSDATLLARANHTGTQTASTISDFTATAAASAPVQSVAGRTGAVTLSSSDISGLGTAATSAATAFAASGGITSSGLTMATARLLGRTTAGAGAVEEIAVSGGTLSGGTLTITGGSTNASDLTSGTLDDARLSAKVMAAVNVTLWSNFR